MLNREIIKNLIKNTGLTKRQIALKANISPQNLYNFLNGKLKSMDVNTAFKLADALGVDINEFREDEEDESR
ncbi:helix-turn-helix transcriptional regulator [Aerococcus viridans]|uniref:helix-turn-helix domain-containing protein n=1 Tax=Aerococcus viridans TaxID=1377 RepID=UPI00223BF32D|nr:helix-turn-helix transcriptional regulator [Aerococcus viridans]MCT1798450.1 helix-turn-helix domain-containing protein [Aerococcus viridans]